MDAKAPARITAIGVNVRSTLFFQHFLSAPPLPFQYWFNVLSLLGRRNIIQGPPLKTLVHKKRTGSLDMRRHILYAGQICYETFQKILYYIRGYGTFSS